MVAKPKGYYPDRWGDGGGWVHVGPAPGNPSTGPGCGPSTRVNMADRNQSLILTEAMISHWLQEHRAEYNSATETLKACLRNFRLHRRHRRMVWAVYSRTDFSHLKGR